MAVALARLRRVGGAGPFLARHTKIDPGFQKVIFPGPEIQ